jgi:hypothetical protein
MSAELQAVTLMIHALPADSRRRVCVIVQILRDLLNADDTDGEVELAFTFVMAELADRRDGGDDE